MIKNTGKYVITILIVLILVTVNTLPIAPINLSQYLGKPENELIEAVYDKHLNTAISFEKNSSSEITEIGIRDELYRIDGISIGDSVDTIYTTYPTEQIVKDMNHIWVGRGQEQHYGIVTEYVIFILDKDNLIQEMRVGYTGDFANRSLPSSNQETEQSIQGKWISQDGRILHFKEGILEDSHMNLLWDKQYYMVISPNKLFITRIKENDTEKVRINCWIDNNMLYIFVVNEEGIPIKESIELFTRAN